MILASSCSLPFARNSSASVAAPAGVGCFARYSHVLTNLQHGRLRRDFQHAKLDFRRSGRQLIHTAQHRGYFLREAQPKGRHEHKSGCVRAGRSNRLWPVEAFHRRGQLPHQRFECQSQADPFRRRLLQNLKVSSLINSG